MSTVMEGQYKTIMFLSRVIIFLKHYKVKQYEEKSP